MKLDKVALRKRAKKAAKTRKANAAMLKRWREVDQPAAARFEELVNFLLEGKEVTLQWNPVVDNGQRLKNGATAGTLVKFVSGGRILRVLPDGYKQPKDWHPGFWELVG